MRVANATERPLTSREPGNCAISWDFWALLADPLLSRELRYRFWKLVSPTVIDVDAICVLSLPAVELIRPLIPLWKKPVLIPSQLAEWARHNPGKDQLAMVDIAIHAGYTLTMAVDRAAAAGLRVRYVWLAMYNDLEDTLPDDLSVAKRIVRGRKERLVKTVLYRRELVEKAGYQLGKRGVVPGLPLIRATIEVQKRANDLDDHVASAFVELGNT